MTREVRKSLALEASVEATVVRCGCGDPDSHNGVRGPAGACPSPRAIERRGVVSYWHRRWIRRLHFKLTGRPWGGGG